MIDDSVVNGFMLAFRYKKKLTRRAVIAVLKKVYRILIIKPNINYVELNDDDRITVIGDLHGHLGDLIHILDHVGTPSASNRLVFNGDFVDRGTESVEVITLIFALLAAYGPDIIYLNRGDIHTYIYKYIHIYIHIYIHTYAFIHIHT